MNNLFGKISYDSPQFYSNKSLEKNIQSLNLDAEFNFQITFFEELNGTKKNSLINNERIEDEIPRGIQKASILRIKKIRAIFILGKQTEAIF